jgi:extracellular factor (EF) 3-hydroxypalmitic acid methyl ester biosynthesis protein
VTAQSTAPVYEGWLTIGRHTLPIHARYASRYSLWIDGANGGGDAVDMLALKVNERVVQIGPCRFLPDPGDEPPRLVSVGGIQDFEKLFFHSRASTLDSAFLNLSLILGYKERISDDFREYVAGLTYDLNVYSTLLDQMDVDCRDEPAAVRELIQASIIASVQPGFFDYLDRQAGELDRIVKEYTEDEHEHHGYYFRRQLWNALLRAPMMARTNVKPRGYNGDSEMMRLIYLNDYQGDSTFGRLLHKYSVGRAAAQAVRNRRSWIASLIHRYSSEHHPKPPGLVRVLSVACGPAMEVTDILTTPEVCRRLHFSLFDQDPQALLEASSLVRELETRHGVEVSVDFIKESVRTMLVTRALQERWGQFHFIYSMGLFDYLTAPVATAVLRKLYQLLEPGGEMVIGNFSRENPNRVFMEYWHDWKIIHRSADDLRRLAIGIPGAEVDVHADETGIQMLLEVRKKAKDG